MSSTAWSAWPEDQGMERSFVRNQQGLRLACFAFPAKQPKAVVLFVHGYGCHARFEFLRARHPGGPHDRYDGSFVQAMRDAGVTVVCYDNQGMGESQRVRPKVDGYFERFEHLATDMLDVHDSVRTSTSLPIFWLGISMGGAICVRAAQLRPDAAAGLVLLSPMISLTKVREEFIAPALGIRNRHLYPIMHQVSECVPTLPVVKKADNAVHPENEKELRSDPLNYTGSVRARVATEFVIVTEDFMGNGSKALETMQCRHVLLLHALADTYVEPDGSVAVFERAQCAGSKALVRFGNEGTMSEFRFDGPAHARKALLALEGLSMWHALTQEPGAERLAAAAAQWIGACVAGK